MAVAEAVAEADEGSAVVVAVVAVVDSGAAEGEVAVGALRLAEVWEPLGS